MSNLLHLVENTYGKTRNINRVYYLMECEALADFIETLGVLEAVAMWLAVMSLRGIRP